MSWRAFRNEETQVDVVILCETDLAIQVTDNGDHEAWLPKSLTKYDEDAVGSDELTEVELPQWLAEEKMLV